MKKALSLTTFAAAAVVAFSASAQVKNLKMQSTWPASLTLQDNFRMFADRMDKIDIKIVGKEIKERAGPNILRRLDEKIARPAQ